MVFFPSYRLSIVFAFTAFTKIDVQVFVYYFVLIEYQGVRELESRTGTRLGVEMPKKISDPPQTLHVPYHPFWCLGDV